MDTLEAVVSDLSRAPLAVVVGSGLGLAVILAFSWWTKRWLCHSDLSRFMKRKKRLIDELHNVAAGFLVFCALSVAQFLVGGSEAGTASARTSIAIQLAILTFWSATMLVAVTSCRAVLAKIDYKLQLESTGSVWIPGEVDFPYARKLKLAILTVIAVLLFAQSILLVNVFTNSLALP
jgi:hypothetical protein